MRYVDGYVLPVPTDKIDEYKTLAKEAAASWIKHGALEYVECVGDDLESVKEWAGVSFPELANTSKEETVIFAFIIYQSREHRDQVNKDVHEDMTNFIKEHGEPKMPFEMKRMAFGGFQSIVDAVAEK